MSKLEPAAESDVRTCLRLMITMATSYQGGHCPVGGEVAQILGIPFPLTMTGLSNAARQNGFDPDKLWPWLAKMRAEKARMEKADATD